jgi:hypothetical protein
MPTLHQVYQSRAGYLTVAHCLVNLPGEDYGTLEQFSANLSSFPEEGESLTPRLGSLSTHLMYVLRANA